MLSHCNVTPKPEVCHVFQVLFIYPSCLSDFPTSTGKYSMLLFFYAKPTVV